MPTVTYNHQPNDTVWVITDKSQGSEICPLAIVKGLVVSVDIQVLLSSTTVTYNVRLLGDTGTIEIDKEIDIYAESDLSGAQAEYNNRLLLL